MPSQYEQLLEHTIVVADTGDVDAIAKIKPQDATTNPSLITKAAVMPEYQKLIDDAVEYANGDLSLAMVRNAYTTCVSMPSETKIDCDAIEMKRRLEYKGSAWYPLIIIPSLFRWLYNLVATLLFFLTPTILRLDRKQDKVSVNFGIEITKIVPGYVSTEVDARLSFDTEGTIKKARQLIALYKEQGIDKSRILIKIAATWEGIQAAKVLETEGITCNLTLIFSIAQAIACAEAGCTLISPFVGRIMDYYKAEELKKDSSFSGFEPSEDPGVVSVTEIYNYYKKYGYNTIVMGASFRNTDEILQLAGCDRLTISPGLIAQLTAESDTTVEKKLDAAKAVDMDIPKISVDEKTFRMMNCMNAMATEKLAAGIRGFAADIEKLEKIIASKIEAAGPASKKQKINWRNTENDFSFRSYVPAIVILHWHAWTTSVVLHFSCDTVWKASRDEIYEQIISLLHTVQRRRGQQTVLYELSLFNNFRYTIAHSI